MDAGALITAAGVLVFVVGAILAVRRAHQRIEEELREEREVEDAEAMARAERAAAGARDPARTVDRLRRHGF